MKHWRELAECRGMDGDLWYPDPDDVATKRAAIAVCMECPVRLECLNHALEVHETGGIWGGMTYRQRTEWRRKQRALA